MLLLMKNYLLLSFILLAGGRIAVQEAAHPESHHSMKGSHRLTPGLGHTHTSKGEVDVEKQWIALPSFSLSYDY